MAIKLVVNGRDLSEFTRVHDGEGLDPADGDFWEPTFSGVPAFTEGAEHVSDAVGNREFIFPLLLDAASRTALHQLIRDINGDLTNGAQVEFATDSADSSTFFDLERGRLEIEYQYMLSVHNTLRALLRLWTRPYGYTGTARLVASHGAIGTPIATQSLIHFPATGLLGDADALGKLEVRVGSKVASTGRVIAYGVHRSASFNPQFHASDGRSEAQASTVVTGASGAIASKFWDIPVSPTTASGVAYTAYLTPPEAHVGRHRVLGIMRSRLDQSLTIWGRDTFGAPLGPTAQASSMDATRWGIVDIGEINVPVRASGQEAVPTQKIELIVGGASGAGVTASKGLQLQALTLVPLELSPGILRTQGFAQTLYAGDTFQRFTARSLLHNSAKSDLGHQFRWIRSMGILGHGDAEQEGGGVISPGKFVATWFAAAQFEHATGATGLYTLGSGLRFVDVIAEVDFTLWASGYNTIASSFASGAEVMIWAKGNPQAGGSLIDPGIRARLAWAPTPVLSIWTGASTQAAAANVMAQASGMQNAGVGGIPHKMILRTFGPTAAVWIGTNPDLSAAPQLAHSGAEVAIDGAPALQAKQGGAAGWPIIFEAKWSFVGSSIDSESREWFRFESHPELRAYQGNASVFRDDLAAEFRGLHPRLPAVGSPGASGPGRAVVLSGELENFVGNDVLDVRLNAVERFRFLR